MKRGAGAGVIAAVTVLAGCQTDSKNYFLSPSDYPGSKVYVQCAVERAVAHAFDNPRWYMNDDLDVVIKAGMRDCRAKELELEKAMREDGIKEYKITFVAAENFRTVWRIAWNKIVKVRRQRLRTMGIR